MRKLRVMKGDDGCSALARPILEVSHEAIMVVAPEFANVLAE